MSAKWDDMAAMDVTPKPTHHIIVSEWVCGAFNNFPEGLVTNTWTKTGMRALTGSMSKLRMQMGIWRMMMKIMCMDWSGNNARHVLIVSYPTTTTDRFCVLVWYPIGLF